MLYISTMSWLSTEGSIITHSARGTGSVLNTASRDGFSLILLKTVPPGFLS